MALSFRQNKKAGGLLPRLRKEKAVGPAATHGLTSFTKLDLLSGQAMGSS